VERSRSLQVPGTRNATSHGAQEQRIEREKTGQSKASEMKVRMRLPGLKVSFSLEKQKHGQMSSVRVETGGSTPAEI
jgi:hypothetical protein